jgi:hypothetical protein
MSALAFTAMLTIALITGADAQHRGGGGHGGGGSHGGGGGSRGGGGSHGGGGSSFRGGGGSRGNVGVRSGGNFHRSEGFRGAVTGRSSIGARGGAYRGAVRGGAGVRSGYAYRGGNRGGVYARGGYRGGAYRGGGYYRGGYRGGYYRGGRYYGYGYGSGFRFGFGWGYPRIGFYLGVLPYGYYPFYYNSLQYYYYGGAFYRPYNGGYQAVVPPVGAAVPSLPDNAQSIVIDGEPYYESNGVYYQESADGNGRKVYIVVGKDGVLNTENGGGSNMNDQPMSDNDDPLMDNNTTANGGQAANVAPELTIKVGDVVDQLPADCRKVTVGSKKFYVSPDNVFYEEFKDADGTGYRVASVPGASNE